MVFGQRTKLAAVGTFADLFLPSRFQVGASPNTFPNQKGRGSDPRPLVPSASAYCLLSTV